MAEEELKPYIIYADGTFATFRKIEKIIIKEQSTGIDKEYNAFYLRPTVKTRKKFNISEYSDKDFIKTGFLAGYYKKLYPIDWCEQLDVSPDSAVWLLFTDYHGNKFIDPVGNHTEIILKKNQALATQNNSLRGIIASLSYEIIKISKTFSNHQIKEASNLKTLLDKIGSPIITSGGEIPRE